MIIGKGKVGDISYNNQGTLMKIIKYENHNDITIEFQDDHKTIVNTYYQMFKKGTIRNPYDKTVYGFGYLGIGKYSTANKRAYGVWTNIIERCYSEYDKIRNRSPAYENCEICEEWLCFQNFADWHESNYYDIGEGRMHIDKDILVKNNKIYAPDKCLFVPQRINMLFQSKSRKDNLPTGVQKNKNNKYTSNYNGEHLGVFKTINEAKNAHDIEMRIHIKEVAEEYKNKIPIKLYEALIKW
jgi:hypothetical protein